MRENLPADPRGAFTGPQPVWPLRRRGAGQEPGKGAGRRFRAFLPCYSLGFIPWGVVSLSRFVSSGNLVGMGQGGILEAAGFVQAGDTERRTNM